MRSIYIYIYSTQLQRPTNTRAPQRSIYLLSSIVYRSMGGGGNGVPLFETKEARFRGAYKVFASTVFVGICFIWVYRLTHIRPAGAEDQTAGRWAWIGMFMAELCFGLYWIVTQSVRLNLVYHHPFKQALSLSRCNLINSSSFILLFFFPVCFCTWQYGTLFLSFLSFLN